MRLRCLLPAMTLMLTTCALAADLHTVIAGPRQRIETADYRATGHLVTVDSAGHRTSYPIIIKAHWFPGVLRTLVDITPPPKSALEQRIRILLEMRPKGPDTIRVAHQGATALSSVPFEKWDEGVAGGEFSYEDLLEPQYYWDGQTILKSARFGTRDCEVLKSTPGATERTHYEQVETWLDHTIDFPVYAEKMLKDRQTIKQFTYFGLRQNGGVWSASQVEAKTRGRAGSSLLIIDRGTVKANLSLKDFSPEQITHF